jgi:hypothetical protein
VAAAQPPADDDLVEEVNLAPDPSDAEPADLPALVMPRIYVRPPKRKRKGDPEEKKRRRALEAAEGRRRKITLPGMPPTRLKSP